MRAERAAFEVNAAHTLAVIGAIPEGAWDRAPGGSAPALRDQLLHLALVRESICRTLAGLDTAGLGTRFEAPEWEGGSESLIRAFTEHHARCLDHLAGLKEADLDVPFTTRFGNRSTPRNYLRVMLVEEVHHRAQMTALMRIMDLEPPPFPGRAWVELGLPTEGA